MTAALSNEEIEARFFLSGRMEIQSVLDELVRRREPVGVHFNGGRDFLLTTLLEVRPDVLVFDLGGHEDANRALLASPGGVMLAQPNGVRVQFSFGQVHRFLWGDLDAFWIDLPERVVRLQRREFYRIVTSLARPQKVLLHFAGGVPAREVVLHDIGVGGVGVETFDRGGLEVDAALAGVVLAIPGHGGLECAGLVRHVSAAGEHRGKPRWRVGLRFVDLGRASEVQIQRYIVAVEHERRALLDT